jgi:hypothetical protein
VNRTLVFDLDGVRIDSEQAGGSLCRPIIVLGAERSGTSVCAEMVHARGAYSGEQGALPAPDRMNARGRWEYLPLWELLDALGEFPSGASWWQESFQEDVTAKAADAVFAERAQALVRRMETRGRPWMWKDPALCHFLGFWRTFWTEPIYLVTVRHPIDIAVSWNQFRRAQGAHETSLRCNLLRWQQMMLLVLNHLDTAQAKLLVEYEQVIEHPHAQASRIASFLDEHTRSRTDETRIAQMAGVVDPTLRRNREGRRRRQLLTASQRSLYRLLRSGPGTPTAALAELYPMPPQWRQLVIAEEAQEDG